MKYTPSQEQAIRSTARNLLVSASAGTGKTTAMVERLVNLIVNEKKSIENMLVVTFTNAAAEQMRDRIRQRLSKIIGNDFVHEQLEKLDICNISTLHSFCAELLKEYFYVVDIDPSYTIVDPLMSANLKDKALDNVIEYYYEKGDLTVAKLCDIFKGSRGDESLKDALLALNEFVKCHHDFSNWYQEKRNLYEKDNDEFERYLNEKFAEKSEIFVAALEKMIVQAKEASCHNFKDFLDNLLVATQITTANSLKSNVDNLVKAFEKLEKLSKANKPSGSITQEQADEMVKDYQDLRSKISKWINTEIKPVYESYDALKENNIKSLEYLDKLVEMLEKYNKEYFSIKKERGVLDFDDLEQLALEILSDNDAHTEISKKYEYIFVDEYQDINNVQEQIVNRIAKCAKTFYVGDVKQSIYGFREANPNIFVKKSKDFSLQPDCELINLNDNFRSDKRILDFVNVIFCSLMTEDFGKQDYSACAMLKGAINVKMPFESVTIDIIPVKTKIKPDSDETDGDIAEEAEETDSEPLIVKKIREFHGKEIIDNGESKIIGYSDIAILVRNMATSGKRILASLKQHNIPVNAEIEQEDIPKEYADIINFLRVLDNPTQNIYAAGVALSVLGGFTEQELAQIKLDAKSEVFIDNFKVYSENHNDELALKSRKFLYLLEKYRELSRSYTADELMLTLITDRFLENGINYAQYVLSLPNGNIRYGQLSKLIESAKGKPYAVTIDKYLSYLDETRKFVSTVSSADAVMLTTIHKSKGLEYPIVIAPNLEKAFRFGNNSKKIYTSEELGLAMQYYDFEDRTISDTMAYLALKEAYRSKSLEEELRLLYVLLTRAKYALALIGQVAADKKITSPKNANCFMDWILYAAKSVTPKIHINITSTGISANTITVNQSNDKKRLKKMLEYQYPHITAKPVPVKVYASRLKQTEEDMAEEPAHVVIFETDKDAARLGTAYHKIFEHAHRDMDIMQLKQLCKELVSKGKLESDLCEKIDYELIFKAYHDKDFISLMQGEIYHEVPFMLRTDYSALTGENISGQTILQGVVDMLIIQEDSATVVDFKYTSNPASIRQKYGPQLKAYALAAQRILKMPVKAYVMSLKDTSLIKIL